MGMATTMVMEFTDRIFLSNYSVHAISAALPAGVPTFIMWSIGISSLLCMLLPISIGIEFFDQGIYYAWGCVLLFVAVLFVLAALRYRRGKWRDMLVVERETLAGRSFRKN